MKLRKSLLTGGLVLMALSVTSCNDDDDNAPAGPLTLKQLAVNDVNNRTTDTALPVEINDLAIDDSNEDSAQYDDLLQSI
jgi:predicted component of type VI protein secretion system